MKTRLEKHKVCDECFTDEIRTDCVCFDGNYTVIELEFDVCECCGQTVNNGMPSKTEFNEKQFKIKQNGTQ